MNEIMAAQEWEKEQARVGGQLLQSAPWAEFQQALGRQLAKRVVEGGASAQAFEHREAAWRYLYVPYGPTVAGSTRLLSRSYWRGSKVDFVRLEPMGLVTAAELRAAGAVPSIELNPAHTAVLDLTLSEEALRGNLNSGHRSAINGAQRRGLSFRKGGQDELEAFLGFIHQTGNRGGFRPHPDSYYRRMLETLDLATLWVAEHEGRVVAAAISLDYRDTRIYAHAAADSAARSLQAAVPLVWHLALDAKVHGFKHFDLWGVAPKDAPASHPWAGFSQFKRGFGGEEVEYAGTWDLPLKPAKYQLYRAARRVGRLVRR